MTSQKVEPVHTHAHNPLTLLGPPMTTSHYFESWQYLHFFTPSEGKKNGARGPHRWTAGAGQDASRRWVQIGRRWRRGGGRPPGNGHCGQRRGGTEGGTMRVWRTSKGGAQRKKGGQTQRNVPPSLHGRAVGWVPTVSFGKRVVREVCEGHAGPTHAGLVFL